MAQDDPRLFRCEARLISTDGKASTVFTDMVIGTNRDAVFGSFVRRALADHPTLLLGASDAEDITSAAEEFRRQRATVEQAREEGQYERKFEAAMDIIRLLKGGNAGVEKLAMEQPFCLPEGDQKRISTLLRKVGL